MSYFDGLVYEELKNLNKNMEKLIYGVNVLAGIESPGIKTEDFMERHVFSEPVYNIEAILERADVEWFDDPITFRRRVISRNPKAPLTELEQAKLVRMWEAQGCKLHVSFEVEGGK